MTRASRFPNVVIRASAGTGKTFQLSNRYLGLALAGEPFDAILATTFTRKAAGEILDRILFRLAEAAEDAEKRRQLAEWVAQPRLDRAACLRLLGDMVRQMHRLRIGTLDSFFLQIARSFSLELGLPPGWQICDEAVDRRLRAEAVRGMLEDESTRNVVELMHLLTKGEANRSVSSQIATVVSDLYSLYAEAPAAAWEALPRRKALGQAELEAALEALAAVPLPEDKRFLSAREQDFQRARLADWEAFVTAGLAAKVADGSGQYYRKPLAPQIVEAYRPLVEHAQAILVNQIVNQTEGTRRLLERFDRVYQPLKLAQRALRFDDVTRKLMREDLEGRLDEIAYRLDGQVAHVLLDEFQDTSPPQWRVLRGFARRAADGSARRSFFCVGDVKQAIYGWRGGVAAIFEALQEELKGLQGQSLEQSFRSSPHVMETANRVFGNLKSAAALDRYSEAAARWAGRFRLHSTARTELAGYCRLEVAPKSGEDADQGVCTLVHAAELVTRLCREAPSYKVGILVRRNAAVARMIYQLRHLGIEASEEGGNPLTDSPAVRLVLSLLTLADHPGDRPARFHVASSPLGESIGLASHDDAAACRLAAEIRRRLITDGYGPTIRTWTAALAPACDSRDLNRLVQLVELAYSYEAGATTRADDFVTLASFQKVENPTDAQVRVMNVHQSKGLQFDIVVLPELDVRLTGQTPAVVVGRPGPTQDIQRVCRYVNEKLRPLLPESFCRMFDEHQSQVVEESLCVLYVALTRAIHGLYMVISPSAANENKIPATAAGLLRETLANGVRAEPGAVLYQCGDPDWFRKPADESRAKTTAAEPATEISAIRLKPLAERPWRGMERRSPSQLEGGSHVDLRFRLRLDTSEALVFGTLMHKCFEQVEWLDGGAPSDELLRKALEPLATPGYELDGVMAVFRQALDAPAVREALSSSTYRSAARGQHACAVHAGPSVARPRWDVWRERTFAVRDGDGLLSGAIDRLVVLYDGDRPVGADLLDYKTDVLPAGDAEAIQARLEVYRPQLDAYRRAVAAMLCVPPDRVSARLAFVRLGMVLSL